MRRIVEFRKNNDTNVTATITVKVDFLEKWSSSDTESWLID